MPVSLYIILLIALAIVACFWLASYLAQNKLKKSIEKESDSTLFLSQFRSVLIKPCAGACKKALEHRSKPILISNAPTLPFKGCKNFQCTCSFVQLEDRRSGVDRRSLESAENRRVYANKRLIKDRRRASIQEFLLPRYRQFG